MFEKKRYLNVNYEEKRLLIESLNHLRTELIAQGRYTDCVDELLIKIVNSRASRFS